MNQRFADNIKNADNGLYFNINDVELWFSVTNARRLQTRKPRNKDYSVYNVPAAFDIETTNYTTEDGDVLATMYVWMFGLNGAVIIGRTWEEFKKLVDFLRVQMDLSSTMMLPVYVHNLPFEFQFIREKFNWIDVFAMEERKIMTGATAEGFLFKCSLVLTGEKLEKVGEKLTTYQVKKKVGDLDYSLLRHSGTPLTREEIGYCINDVLVVMCHVMECMEREGGSITKIPMTKTGYARRLCRNACLNPKDANGDKDKKAAFKYKKLMEALTLSLDEYLDAKRAFLGGFTHANAWNAVTLHKNVKSYDETSAYPAAMVACKYPMTRGRLLNVSAWKNHNTKAFHEMLDSYIENFCCLMSVTFTGIDETFIWDHYISTSRCQSVSSDAIVDNGRVVKAKSIELTMTELDYQIIKKTYKWKSMEIHRLRYYTKGYLPKPYIETILDLYEKKTALKGVPGMEEEYQLSKELLNSLYGMMCTDICREDIGYDVDWHKTTIDDFKNVNEYNKNRADKLDEYNDGMMRFMSYLWGVWCTAHARSHLWQAILECGPDYVYADTDSCKFLNPENHMQFFETYNKEMEQKMRDVCEYYGIAYERTCPKTVKGEVKHLGAWDDDGDYARFKTLGAKRYMTEDMDGNLSLTVSGVNKNNAIPYLLAKYKSNTAVFNAFNDGLEIPPTSELKHPVYDKKGNLVTNPAGKLVHSYIDFPTSGEFSDYLGNRGHWEEDTSVSLRPGGYSLGLSGAYAAFLMGLVEAF